MPRKIFGKDFQFLPRAEILTFEEIDRLVRIFVSLGVQKIRLTGGEPLVRRDLERLVEKLAKIGDLDLTLTTNGSLLSQKARALATAGLRRVTVSLDSPDDATFKRMNDADFPVAKVLAGIEAAHAAGLAPIKINMVTKRGVNESSIVPMARYFKGTGMTLRFIEFMDVGSTNGWRLDDVVPAREIVALIDREMPLEPMAPAYRGEVANRYRYKDGSGEIGIIASVTQPFCADCTRARLAAEPLRGRGVHAKPFHALRHDLVHVRCAPCLKEAGGLLGEARLRELADRVDETLFEQGFRRRDLLVPAVADDRPGHGPCAALLQQWNDQEAALHRPDEIAEDRFGRAADERRPLKRHQRLAEARLLLRVVGRGALHPLDIPVVEDLVPVGSGHVDQRAGDVRIETHRSVQVSADPSRRLLPHVPRAAVHSEHHDHSAALLARVGIVIRARLEPERPEHRPVEVFDESLERRVRRVAYRVVRYPIQRLGDRLDDRAIFLATQRFEPAHELRERRLAVTGERP